MSGNVRSQSSQIAEPLWTDPGIKNEIGVRELISTLEKKSAGWEYMIEHSPKMLASEDKSHTPVRLSVHRIFCLFILLSPHMISLCKLHSAFSLSNSTPRLLYRLSFLCLFQLCSRTKFFAYPCFLEMNGCLIPAILNTLCLRDLVVYFNSVPCCACL